MNSSFIHQFIFLVGKLKLEEKYPPPKIDWFSERFVAIYVIGQLNDDKHYLL